MLDLSIYAITDRGCLVEGKTLFEAVEEAILGGATMIQYREKQLAIEEKKACATKLLKLCRSYHVPLIINDDVMLAKEIGADGVHVGQSDLSVMEARRILGDAIIIGATAKTIEQAKRAEAEGADYLGSGAIFGTTTKQDAKPMTMELLQEICHSVSIPVVAIGGINAQNISKLQGVEIRGVAVVSGIFGANNCKREAMQLRSKLYHTPIIQCITNHVTSNQVANMVLASGGSPIMAHHPMEVLEVQEHAAALLVNLGAVDDYDAMLLAYQTAVRHGHVIVLDPVGISGITFRRSFVRKMLEIASPTVVRGNYSEILALYQDRETGAGLDAGVIQDAAIMEEIVTALARRLGSIVVATGAHDLISDGRDCILETSGHPMQKKLTGSGCMLSAKIATEITYGCVSAKRVANICKNYGDSAYRAAVRCDREEKGIRTFEQYLFDEL